MMVITGGTIGYSRVKKDDDYGINRKGEASLSFTVEEGTELDTSAIEQQVFDIAHRLLTKQFTAAKAAATKAEPEAGVKSDAVSPPAPAMSTGSAPLSDKEKLAEAAGIGAGARKDLEAKTAAQFGQTPPTRAPRAPRKPKEESVPVVADDDPLGLGIVVETVKTVEPVTDAELGSATVARNREIQKPDAIRALIAEFAGPPPKQARDIPQDKRHAYLEKLKTLS